MVEAAGVCVVMPAYNAAPTIERTYREVPREVVDRLIVVDDGSHDETASIARNLGLETLVHAQNRGYGANQKTCYRAALEGPERFIVMLHPDYQYTPKLIPAMVAILDSGLYDLVLGSRILGKGALEGGMPLYKYVSNRVLTLLQNLLIGHKLSEYHTGYRAFHRRVLESLPLESYSDDFLFDNQVLVGAIEQGYRIAEVSCPTSYFEEASSISFTRSVRYGLGVLAVSFAAFVRRLRP